MYLATTEVLPEPPIPLINNNLSSIGTLISDFFFILFITEDTKEGLFIAAIPILAKYN